MIRKMLCAAGFGVFAICIGLMTHQHVAFAAAYPCNVSPPYGLAACQGYFDGGQGTPTDVYNDFYNVLPSPAYQNVTDASTFESAVNNYLNIPGGVNHQAHIGAAFLIDTMLNHGGFQNSGGDTAGIAYAKANFNTWVQLVNHYANAPNGSYGIRWNYMPSFSQFCGTPSKPTLNSTYLPQINDDVFHATICPYGYTAGTPIIEFFWPGGNFQIGKGCGNMEMSASPIPFNTAPTGTIAVTCNTASWQQIATLNFSDADGATSGYITTGNWTSGTVGSGGARTVTIPVSAADPYTAQTVNLWVKDVGPGGGNQYRVVATTNTQVPCATLACGSINATPTHVDPYMGFSITANVTNNVNQTPPGAMMTLKVSPPSGASYSYTKTQNAGGAGSVSTATFSDVGPTNAAGVYNATWTLQWSAGSTTCTGTFPVVYLPYLSVYGGDVSVGSSPSSVSGSCASTSDTNAGIYSWNNHTSDFSGAGAQYAVQALSAIVDFASAQDGGGMAPTGLSFANYFTPVDTTKLDPAQGLFGGYAGSSSADCDFTSDISAAPVTTDTTIGATTVPAGGEKIYYVKNADVYINGNIVYANPGGGWTATQIPYFKLVVVNGNIYIDSSVTQLDGIYVAEPEAGKNGNIYTCASGIRSPADPTSSGYYAQCSKQLAVNGAFVAGQVSLLRTYGSLGQARTTDTVSSSHSGEVFNYTPELWLPRAGVPSNGSYSAITALPPVL